MLTPEQIDAIFTEAHNADGSRGFRYIVGRAIYVQALKDAAEVCGKLEEEELCLDVSSDEGKHGYAHERLAQAAAAILALGKENP